MANGGQIRYNVGFNIDKTGLNELTKILQNVQTELTKTGSMGKTEAEIQKTITAAKQLEGVLNSAWNSKLNQLDLSKVSSGIKSTFGSVQQLKAQMEASGASGAAAYNKVASAVLNTNLQLKQSNKLLDNMATTMANTVKWGITSSIFNRITGSIQEAWGYTKRLDGSLNDIRIVTNKSAEEMQKFAKQANEAAKALGKGTVDYTDASLIYYQQGLSEEEVAARAEVTLKAANVTGQSTQEVSEQLTAVWNGYKVSAQEAELYVDKLAAVAASTAADLEELSTGMSKVASAANSMGVDIDQLNAQLATIVSVTRQAPESVGTALKTIYARLGDLAVDGEDEFGVALGTVSKTMEEMGIQILDEQGQMRDMGEVIEETAAKWDTWSEAQRQAAAVAMAGKRQYNNLIALFDNWDMYTDALNTSVDATGTLQKQQDIYMESTQAHLAQLKTETEETYDILFNEKTINGFIDSFTGVVSVFNDFIKGVGGGGQAIMVLGGLIANVFSKQIGGAISTQLENMQKLRDSQDATKLKQDIINAHQREGEKVESNAALDMEVEVAQKLLSIKDNISQEEYNQLTVLQTQMGLDAERLDNAKNYARHLENFPNLEKRSLDTIRERLSSEEESLERNREQLIAYEQIAMTLENIEDSSTAQRELAFFIAENEERINELIDEQYLDIENADALYAELCNESLTREEVEERLQRIINAQNRAINQSEENVENLTNAVEDRVFLESEEYRLLEAQQDANQRLIDQTVEQAQAQAQLQAAMQGITAVITLMTSLVGIFETLSNEELSVGEKVKQILTVALAMLPVVIQNFSAFSQIIPGVTRGILMFAGGLGASTAGVTTLTGAMGALWTVLAPILPIILGVTAAIGALIGVVYLCVDAYNADAEAAKKAAEAAKEAAKAANEAKEAYEKLADSFGAYDEAIKKLEELTEGTEEYKEALKSANDQAMELIKANKNLAKYATRDEKGLITFENADAEIAAARAKASLAGSAANLSQATANEAQLKADTTETARGIKDAAGYSWGLTSNQIMKLVEVINTQGGLEASSISKALGTQNQALIASIMDAIPELEKLAQETANLNATNKLLREDALRTSLGMNANYAALGANEQEVVASLYGEGLTDAEIEKLRKEAEADYDDEWGGEDEEMVHDQYAAARGWTIVKDKAGKAVYADAYGNEQIISDDTARAYLTELQVAEKMASYNEDNLNNITEGVRKISAVGNSFGGNVSSEFMGFLNKKDTQFEEGSLSPEMLESLRNDLAKSISGVTEAEWDALGYASAQTFLDAVNKSLDSYNMAPYWEKVAASTQENLSVLSNSLNELYSGNGLDEKTIEELEEKYSELGSIQKKNSYEYIKALEKIRELEEDNLRQALANEDEANKEREENIRKEIEELESKRNSAGSYSSIISYNEQIKKLEEELDEILTSYTDNTYEIKLAIDADLSSDIENAFGLANEFENIRSMITDDLKISFDQAQEFISKGYGDILIDAKETSEGMIQLNAAATQAFIDGKRAELNISKDNKIEQLEQERAMLTSQLEILETQLVAYESAVAAESMAKTEQYMNEAILAEGAYQGQVQLMNEELKNDDEQKIELTDNANKFYTALSDIYKTDAENSMTATDDADTATQTYQQNVINYYEKMHKAASQYAAAVKAAAAGEDVGEFSVTAHSGENINTTAQLKEVSGNYAAGIENELTVEEIFGDQWTNLNQAERRKVAEQMAEDTRKRIETLKQQIGSVDAAIAALRSSGDALDDTYGGVGNGADDASGKNADFAESLESIYDRYREINNQLKILDTNLGRVQSKQEKLTGKGYIQNLEKQLDIIKQQIEANKEKMSIAEQEMAEVMAALAMQGANFNDAGQVTNYKELVDGKLAETNAIIDAYNSMTAEQQEAYKATMDAATESYEALLTTFERFDELYTEEIPGLMDTIQELLDQAVELQIEKFNTEIQISLDMKQAEREWNEFQAKILHGLKDDDLAGQAKLGLIQWETYYGDENDTVEIELRKLEELNEQANQLLEKGWSDIYGDNYAKLYEDITATTQQLMTDMEAAEALAEGIYNNYLSSIDKVIEGNDAVIKQYEYINGLLDHNVKLIELLGANEKSSMLTEQYAKKNELNQQMIKEHQENAAYYEEMMNSIEDKTSEEWQKWSEAWQNEVTALNSAIIQGMEDAAAAYANAIDVAMQEMESAFTNGMGFDYIQDEWDLVNENADKYLDTINAAYEISSLENKFTQAINSTESLSAQKKLRAAMEEELKLLEEADQVSQYDIDRANLKYELTLKQIALEEAQNNKSTMKLKRDSQGNFSYVFAADQDEIAKAQQELADAENELYNFDKDAYREKTEAILKAEQDLQAKLQEIWTNENLSEEQKLQYSEMINKQYRDIIEADMKESEKAKQNLSDDTLQVIMKNYQKELAEAQKTARDEESAVRIAVEKMQKQFKGLVDTSNPESTISIFKDLANTWGDGSDYKTLTGSMKYGAEKLVSNMQMTFDTGLSNISERINGDDDQSFRKIMQAAMEACKTASNDYGNTLAQIAESAGANLTGLATSTNGVTLSTTNLKNILNDLILKNDDYISKVTDGKNGTLSAAQALSDQYKAQYDNVAALNQKMAEYGKYLDEIKKKSEDAAKAARDLANALKEQTPAGGGGDSGGSGVSGGGGTPNQPSGGGGGGSSQPAPTPSLSDNPGGAFDDINSGRAGNGAARQAYLSARYTSSAISRAQAAINEAYSKGWTRDKVRQVYGFDTGGYTGDWHSSEGRIALLHEKEIVLNKTDTSNLLDIVSMVREMTSSSLRGANGMMSGVMEALATVTNNSNNNTSQNIHITAEFPNVRVASEIEEAFNNLANIASQHAFQY